MSSPAKSQNGAAEADAAALAEAERLALEKIGGTPKKSLRLQKIIWESRRRPQRKKQHQRKRQPRKRH